MPERDVSEPYVEMNRPIDAHGHRAEDEPDIDGYDETQRAEIAEVEGDGPSDGLVMTDLMPDASDDFDDDELDVGANGLNSIIDTDTGIIR